MKKPYCIHEVELFMWLVVNDTLWLHDTVVYWGSFLVEKLLPPAWLIYVCLLELKYKIGANLQRRPRSLILMDWDQILTCKLMSENATKKISQWDIWLYPNNIVHTGQVNGDRGCVEERERFVVELKVLIALAPGPYVPWKRGPQRIGM